MPVRNRMSLTAAIAPIVMFSFIATANEPDLRHHEIEARKHAFLTQLADTWKEAGYPVAWAHDEWKHNEIEPNWAGAMAAMRLKRSTDEIHKANTFFETMPLDEHIDPDMRICEILHSYYLFRDDPDLRSTARRHLLELIHFHPAPRRLNPSIWIFGATENHAFMGHVWCLLLAQIDRDRSTFEAMRQHIDAYIVEHTSKGWLEYNSPCYVEKEVGCLIMIAEWAEDPLLRCKAELGLDVLFAEHAALNLEGMLCGPACRVYRPGYEGILTAELNHNSRRDARCSGSYPLMHILFGQGSPHYYGVLGAPLLATSRYVPPAAVDHLATSFQNRGAYVFKARRPGRGHKAFRANPSTGDPGPEVFNARVYAYVTPQFVLGSFQEVEGVYGASRSLPLSSVLRMGGNTRRVIYTDLVLGGREEVQKANVDCVQHLNVSMGRGIGGQAYLATREFDEVIERDGWIMVRANRTFAAYRVVDSGYQWEHADGPSVFGDFIKFDDAGAPFILEVASADDYKEDFSRFQADILNNSVEPRDDGVTYQSGSDGEAGPSSDPFVLTLRYGQIPLLNQQPINLDDYGTFDSPYLNSTWNSGIVTLRSGPHRMTINVTRSLAPERTEETIDPRPLPYKSNCDVSDDAWTPFLNYWRLKPEQWYWDREKGRSGGCLCHHASLGVQKPERGAHDAAILLRGGENWTNYSFEADARASKGHLGLWFRADMQDEGGGNGRWVQGYYFVVDPAHHKCRLWRARLDHLVTSDPQAANQATEVNHFSNPLLLAEVRIDDTLAYGQWMHLSAKVRFSSLQCFVDGKKVFDIENGVYATGSVGLVTYKGTDVRFDNIQVLPLQ